MGSAVALALLPFLSSGQADGQSSSERTNRTLIFTDFKPDAANPGCWARELKRLDLDFQPQQCHGHRMCPRPSWPLLALVTFAALAITIVRHNGYPIWPTEVLAFSLRWAFIAAFAMFGRAIFTRSS